MAEQFNFRQWAFKDRDKEAIPIKHDGLMQDLDRLATLGNSLLALQQIADIGSLEDLVETLHAEQVNLLSDWGRCIAPTSMYADAWGSQFQPQPLWINKEVLIENNGSVFTKQGNFIYDNSNNGGIAGSMESYTASMTIRKYGETWNTVRITSGTGTSDDLGNGYYKANRAFPTQHTMGLTIAYTIINGNDPIYIAATHKNGTRITNYDYNDCILLQPNESADIIFQKQSNYYYNMIDIYMKPNTFCVIGKIGLFFGICKPDSTELYYRGALNNV